MEGSKRQGVSPSVCPLCLGDDLTQLVMVRQRRYHDCARCGLLHLDPCHRLDARAEQAHYGHHQNDPADPRYRAFLDQLARPLVDRLPTGASGLDYGAGPGPTLSVMLRKQGFTMADYDPFFAPHPALLERQYDFITCTETAEHFWSPGAEFVRLVAMLHPGGILAVMTECLRDGQPLDQWRYLRDPTHVVFYRTASFAWIAARHGLQLEQPQANVALLRRAQGPGETSSRMTVTP